MKITLKNLRRIVAEAIQESSQERLLGDLRHVTLDDFLASCAPYTPTGRFWAPYQEASEFRPGSKVAERCAWLRETHGIVMTPFHVLSSAKRDDVRVENDRRQGITLLMSNVEKQRVASWLATLIFDRFKDAKIDLVLPLGSSSPFVTVLADEVAADLGASVMHDVLTKAKKPVHNPGRLSKASSPEAEEARAKLLQKQDTKNRGLGRAPKSPDFKPSLRRYYEPQDIDQGFVPGLADRVLVIDDNFKEGTSFKRLADRLKERGFREEDVVFAAGVKLLT